PSTGSGSPLYRREQSRDVRARQNMTTPARVQQSVIQRLGPCCKVPLCRDMQEYVERVHRNHVLVSQWILVSRRIRSIVPEIAETICHISTKLSSSRPTKHLEATLLCSNVLNAPMCEACRNIVHDYDEASRVFGDAVPLQLCRLIATWLPVCRA